MAGKLHVERVFPVTFRPGPIVWGTVSGELSQGDLVALLRSDGTRVTGRIVNVDFNRPTEAREDQFGFVIVGGIADVVQVGDCIFSVDDSELGYI